METITTLLVDLLKEVGIAFTADRINEIITLLILDGDPDSIVDLVQAGQLSVHDLFDNMDMSSIDLSSVDTAIVRSYPVE